MHRLSDRPARRNRQLSGRFDVLVMAIPSATGGATPARIDRIHWRAALIKLRARQRPKTSAPLSVPRGPLFPAPPRDACDACRRRAAASIDRQARRRRTAARQCDVSSRPPHAWQASVWRVRRWACSSALPLRTSSRRSPGAMSTSCCGFPRDQSVNGYHASCCLRPERPALFG